jgi:transposase-like protein
MTAAKLRLAMASMGKRETNIAALCEELGITRQTLYRHVAPDGTLRADRKKALHPSWIRARGGGVDVAGLEAAI